MVCSRYGRFALRHACTALFGLTTACSLTPLSITGHFDSDAKLLEQGAPAQFNAESASAELRQQIPLLYSYAYEAGLLTSDADPPGEPTSPKKSGRTASASLSDQNIADEETKLLMLTPADWKLVAQAGETSIDLSCSRYESALYALDKNRKAILANLNATQSASVAIMGLALAAQKSIGIVGTAFGLAASLFDTTVNSVLFQLPPASVVSVIDAQRDVYRSKESDANADWAGITNPIAVVKRLNEYIRYCTPAIIEANVGKLLGQTKLDPSTGKLTAETEPATQPTIQTIQRRVVMPTDLVKQVIALTPAEALLVWHAMAPALAERSQPTRTAVRNRFGIAPDARWDPTTEAVTAAQAKAGVNFWVVLDEGTEPNKAEWTKALETVAPATPPPAPRPKTVKAAAPAVTRPWLVAGLQEQVALLQPADALLLAGLMYPDLSSRSKAVQDKLHGFVANKNALTQSNAPLFLALWLGSDTLDPAFEKRWRQALNAVKTQLVFDVPSPAVARHFSAAFQKKIETLQPTQALAVAKSMYPHLGARSSELKAALGNVGVKSADDLNLRNSGPFLDRWITFDLETDQSQGEWQAALDSLPH